MRRTRWLLALITTTTLLAACSGDGGGDSSTATTASPGAATSGSAEQATPPLSKDEIRLSAGIDAAYAPFFLAVEEGMFEKAGLNVKILKFPNAAEGVDNMIAGDAVHVGGSGDSSVLARATRGDIRALGVFQESGRYMKLVVKQSINDPSEIKKLGMVPASLSEYATLRLLESEGIAPDAVTLVRAGPPELAPLLQKGDIDGFVLWEPWPTQAESLGGKVLQRTEDFGYSYVQMVVADGPWLDGHPNEAKAMMKVIGEANRMVEQDPERAAKAVKAQNPSIPEAQTRKAVEDIDYELRDVTDADRQNFVKIGAFNKERGVTKADPDLTKLLTPGYLP